MTRVAVVAGAGGAGAAVAADLVTRGFHVVVLDSRAEAAQLAAQPLLDEGYPAESRALDLLDVDAVSALHDDLVARLGGVDVVVHLVGGWRGTSTLEAESYANWNALHPPVVGTLASLTSVFGETVRSSAKGRVFMVTSTAAAKPTAGGIAYAAAKSAAEAWTAGVADYFQGSQASAVVLAVKALLTDQMLAAEPERTFPGYTHVRDLAAAIGAACDEGVENGARIDLTGSPAI